MMSGLWEYRLLSWEKKIEVVIDQLGPTRDGRGSVTSHQSSLEFSLRVFPLSPRQLLLRVSPARIFPFMDIFLSLNRYLWCFKWDLDTGPQLVTLFEEVLGVCTWRKHIIRGRLREFKVLTYTHAVISAWCWGKGSALSESAPILLCQWLPCSFPAPGPALPHDGLLASWTRSSKKHFIL